MGRMINNPDYVVEDMLQGFLEAHGDLIARTENPRVLKYKYAPLPGKVGIVTGGGSGHKPAFIGYIGKNMCDAAAVGEVFSSPAAQAFLDAIKAADSGRGVACLYGNYAGDNMNVKMAIRMAEKEGITVKTVVANDDAASAPLHEKDRRRGVAGEILMWKIAGAKAAAGGDLDGVIRAAQKAIDNTRSVGIGTKPCTIPAVGHPNFRIEEGNMLDIILPDLPFQENDEVAVLLSGLGATPVMEQYIVYNKVAGLLKEKGIRVCRSYVGNYFTSLDMMGVTLTLMKLDEELKGLLETPVQTVGLTQF